MNIEEPLMIIRRSELWFWTISSSLLHYQIYDLKQSFETNYYDWLEDQMYLYVSNYTLVCYLSLIKIIIIFFFFYNQQKLSLHSLQIGISYGSNPIFGTAITLNAYLSEDIILKTKSNIKIQCWSSSLLSKPCQLHEFVSPLQSILR